MIKATGTRLGLTSFLLVSASVHLLFLYPSVTEKQFISDQSLPSMAIALTPPSPIRSTPRPESLKPVKPLSTAVTDRPTQKTLKTVSASRPQQASSEIKRHIQTRLAEHFRYPLMAKRRGYQGTVTLNFHIKSNGQLEKILIGKSSGYEILDRSALAALLKVNKLENIEQWLQGEGINMILPVRYQLHEG